MIVFLNNVFFKRLCGFCFGIVRFSTVNNQLSFILFLFFIKHVDNYTFFLKDYFNNL